MEELESNEEDTKVARVDDGIVDDEDTRSGELGAAETELLAMFEELVTMLDAEEELTAISEVLVEAMALETKVDKVEEAILEPDGTADELDKAMLELVITTVELAVGESDEVDTDDAVAEELIPDDAAELANGVRVVLDEASTGEEDLVVEAAYDGRIEEDLLLHFPKADWHLAPQ